MNPGSEKYMQTFGLSGKKVLITGSGRGIGRSTALAMAMAGADVAVHYRRDEAAAHETAEEIRQMGRDCLVLRAEMESQEEIEQMFQEIRQRWGRLDVFVANAAASAFKSIAELKDYHLERTYKMVLHSLVICVQQAVPLMTGSYGRIIAMSSMGSDFTLPRYAVLGSAKAALESLVRYIAAEYGSQNITCNALNPGVVDTDSARYYGGNHYEAYRKDVIRHTPLRRLANPRDVADAAVFLASDASRFITGQTIRIDGGLTLLTGGFESF